MRNLTNFVIGLAVILIYPLIGLAAAGIEYWISGSFDWVTFGLGPVLIAIVLAVVGFVLFLITVFGAQIRLALRRRRVFSTR